MSRNLSPYTQSKIQCLQDSINKLSQRQRDLKVELHRSHNTTRKSNISCEIVTNSALIRICNWLKLTMLGKSLERKLDSDLWFLKWIKSGAGYYIYDYQAELFGVDEKDYKCQTYCGPMSWIQRPRGLYYHIYNYLFPDKEPGIFGWQSGEDIERMTWRDYFKELIEKETEKFKEIKNH